MAGSLDKSAEPRSVETKTLPEFPWFVDDFSDHTVLCVEERDEKDFTPIIMWHAYRMEYVYDLKKNYFRCVNHGSGKLAIDLKVLKEFARECMAWRDNEYPPTGKYPSIVSGRFSLTVLDIHPTYKKPSVVVVVREKSAWWSLRTIQPWFTEVPMDEFLQCMENIVELPFRQKLELIAFPTVCLDSEVL